MNAMVAPLLTMCLIGVGHADVPAKSGVILLRRCEISYERTTTLGAFVLVQAGGRVQDCYVKPGDRVKAGQVVARLHDRDAVVELERLTAAAANDIDARMAEAKLAVAQAKLRRHETLNVRKLMSQEELDVDRLEVKSFAMEIEQARQRRRNDEMNRRRMEAEVRSREMVAPHDGVVVEIVKNVGESCVCNEAVIRMVADDRVKVTGYLDVVDTWRVGVGHRVRMVPEVEGAEVAIGRRPFRGRIVFVDPRIDPMSRTCQVVAEVDNRDHLLRSGLQATMEIDLSDADEPIPQATKPTREIPAPR